MRRSGLAAFVLLSCVCGHASAGAALVQPKDDDRGPVLPFRISGCEDTSGQGIPCGYAPALPAPALRPAPAPPGTSFAVGLLALEENRLRDAEFALKKAVRAEMPDAWLALAWTLHLAGKHAEAEAAFDRVSEEELASDWIADNGPALTRKYNEGLALLVAGRPAEAEPLLRQSLVKVPGWQPANALGIALSGQGRHAEAYSAYREAVRYAAGDLAMGPAALALVQRNLAFTLARLGRTDDAKAAIARALELVPDDPEFKALARAIAGEPPLDAMAVR